MPVTANTYDAVPYDSFPHAQTHPRVLRSIAKLFGMSPPALETARVLELGCAAGGNCIPIAVDYPNARVVGVDLSAKQIGDGRRVVEALGLANIELRNASIMDIDASYGLFDYIVVHGVFSWVPDEVQRKILAVCKANLTPDGVAFVSYNTLPGWNMVRSIRDMMMYHTRFFADPAIKAQQARALLKFVQDATQAQKTPYAELVRTEAAILQNQSDNYLLHDHLEENNIQLYFYQFMERANAAGLIYVGDTAIASMYTGNLPEQVAAPLNAANDIVRTEQYMDFLNNRRFRNTILCHGSTTLNRRLGGQDVADQFSISGNLALQGDLAAVNLDTDNAVTFSGAVTYTVNNRNMTAMLLALADQNGQPIAVDDLVAAAARKLKAPDAAALRKVWADNVLRLVLAGALTLHSDLPRAVTTVSARPKASPLARYQAANSTWVTTQRHLRLNVDQVSRIILQMLDGTNDRAAVVARLVERVKSRELGVSREGKELTDPTAIAAEVDRVVGEQLQTFAKLGVLVA